MEFSKPCYFLTKPPYGYYHFMDNYKRRDRPFYDLLYRVTKKVPKQQKKEQG